MTEGRWWAKNSPHPPNLRNITTGVKYGRHELVAAMLARGYTDMPASATSDPQEEAIGRGDEKMLRILVQFEPLRNYQYSISSNLRTVLLNHFDDLLPAYFRQHPGERRDIILQALFVCALCTDRLDIARRAMEEGFPLHWDHLREQLTLQILAHELNPDYLHALTPPQAALLEECIRRNVPKSEAFVGLLLTPGFPAPVKSVLLDLSRALPDHRARMDAALLDAVGSVCLGRSHPAVLSALIAFGADLSTIQPEEFTKLAEEVLSKRRRNASDRRMKLVEAIARVQKDGFPEIARRLGLIRTKAAAEVA